MCSSDLDPEYKKMFPDGFGGYRAVVGHNRSATRGGITTETAHQFQEGPITIVHNGTLIDTSQDRNSVVRERV